MVTNAKHCGDDRITRLRAKPCTFKSKSPLFAQKHRESVCVCVCVCVFVGESVRISICVCTYVSDTNK